MKEKLLGFAFFYLRCINSLSTLLHDLLLWLHLFPIDFVQSLILYKLKPNVSRVLLVNVLNQVPPHFFPLKYFGTYPKKNSYIKNILNYFSGNLFLFNQNIFRKKEESKKGVHLCEEGEEGEGACISLTRTEAIFFS